MKARDIVIGVALAAWFLLPSAFAAEQAPWGYDVNFNKDKIGEPDVTAPRKLDTVNRLPTSTRSAPRDWSQPLSIAWVVESVGDLRDKPVFMISQGPSWGPPRVSFAGPPDTVKATRFAWDWVATKGDVNCGSFALINAQGARLLCITFASTGQFYIHSWYQWSLYAGRYQPYKAVHMEVRYDWSGPEGIVDLWIDGEQVLQDAVTVGKDVAGPHGWDEANFGQFPDGFSRMYGSKGSWAIDNIRVDAIAGRKEK